MNAKVLNKMPDFFLKNPAALTVRRWSRPGYVRTYSVELLPQQSHSVKAEL